MEEFNFDYDSETDDLFIYQGNKKSAGAVELGNFILDFDEKGNLIAMQIMYATEIFSKLLSKIKEISRIKEIKINIVNFRNMEAINFIVTDDKTQERANILIPHIREKSPVLNY